MSTIKVNNLQNASGGSNSTPEEIEQGRAKAWVNFDGTGTIAIRDSFNVSSLTDNNTGDYTVNFTNSFGNTNYCFQLSCTDSGSGGNVVSLLDGSRVESIFIKHAFFHAPRRSLCDQVHYTTHPHRHTRHSTATLFTCHARRHAASAAHLSIPST